MKFPAAIVALVILTTGCATHAPFEARPGIPFIVLQRTGCLGTCPDYTLTIYEDGLVRFEGRNFVKRRGSFTARADRTAVAALFAKVEAIGFWSMPNDFSGVREIVKDGQAILEFPPTDHPSRFVTVVSGGRHKTISDYWGAPPGLRELQELIDRVGTVERWVGRAFRKEAEQRGSSNAGSRPFAVVSPASASPSLLGQCG